MSSSLGNALRTPQHARSTTTTRATTRMATVRSKPRISSGTAMARVGLPQIFCFSK
tara:strand:+ start:263 stop:430 length:168 start_codon:yes stop_codon:yes gene_type:complete